MPCLPAGRVRLPQRRRQHLSAGLARCRGGCFLVSSYSLGTSLPRCQLPAGLALHGGSCRRWGPPADWHQPAAPPCVISDAHGQQPRLAMGSARLACCKRGSWLVLGRSGTATWHLTGQCAAQVASSAQAAGPLAPPSLGGGAQASGGDIFGTEPIVTDCAANSQGCVPGAVRLVWPAYTHASRYFSGAAQPRPGPAAADISCKG